MILTSMRVGVVVLTPALRVQTWNAHSTELGGLRPDEAEGDPFLGLEFGLPVEQLKPALRAAVDDATPTSITLDARNRRGQDFQCAVTVVPMDEDDGQRGVIVLFRDAADNL